MRINASKSPGSLLHTPPSDAFYADKPAPARTRADTAPSLANALHLRPRPRDPARTASDRPKCPADTPPIPRRNPPIVRTRADPKPIRADTALISSTIILLPIRSTIHNNTICTPRRMLRVQHLGDSPRMAPRATPSRSPAPSSCSSRHASPAPPRLPLREPQGRLLAGLLALAGAKACGGAGRAKGGQGRARAAGGGGRGGSGDGGARKSAFIASPAFLI